MGLWDVVSGARLGSFQFHSGSVKSVDSMREEPSESHDAPCTLSCDYHMTFYTGMFVSSCRDGSICVWDTRCSSWASGHRPVNTINNAHMPSAEGVAKKKKRRSSTPNNSNLSVTSVLFHGDNKIVSVGSGDGYEHVIVSILACNSHWGAQ